MTYRALLLLEMDLEPRITIREAPPTPVDDWLMETPATLPFRLLTNEPTGDTVSSLVCCTL